MKIGDKIRIRQFVPAGWLYGQVIRGHRGIVVVRLDDGTVLARPRKRVYKI